MRIREFIWIFCIFIYSFRKCCVRFFSDSKPHAIKRFAYFYSRTISDLMRQIEKISTSIRNKQEGK